jgi:hypothetical protein
MDSDVKEKPKRNVIELKGNTRLPEESYKTYRERIHIENRALRLYLKLGYLIWNSKNGPYYKEKK